MASTDKDGSGQSSSGEESDMKKMMQAQNRKKKKSGGFQSMGLSHAVFKAITRKGYRLPTPIQRKTIPVIMDGKDVVAMARTGSGKTAAFLVPMLERLKMHSSKGARALILSPTRELALQTLKFTKELGKLTDLRAAAILGGDKMEDQFAAMHQNPDIIVATPGRLLHILVEMNKHLREINYVVFDEADRLFEMGFAEQLKEILHRVPESRQTLLFSATLPQTLVSFAQAGLTDPTLIRLDLDTKLSAQLKLSFFWCLAVEKDAILLHLLRNVIRKEQLTVVFAATKHHVEYLNMLLTQSGIDCTYIYSMLDQTARKINVAKFQQKKVSVLIVTDLAARGIDIPQLDNVINYNFPGKAKLFVHRVGRVARAGRSGTAYSLVASDELSHLVDLHIFLGRSLKVVPKLQHAEDEDGYLGHVPRSIISDLEEELQQYLSLSIDLQNQKRVCINAYKQYLRSRPPASSESIKRGKELEKEIKDMGMHPVFKNEAAEEEENTPQDVLSVIRNFKSRATIFEINATSKKACHAVMRAKRDLHDKIIERAREQKTSYHKPSTETDRDVDSQSAACEAALKAFQEIGTRKRKGKVLTRSDGEKKKEKKPRLVKDEENFVAYNPANMNTEAGYKMGDEMSRAVLDFTGDDDKTIKSLKNTRKWDRKKKKFVTESNEGKTKKVKTESGNWIPASYQSKLYQSWVRKEKQGDNDDSDDNDNNSSQYQQGKRRNNNQKHKMQITGTRRRSWHTRGTDKGEERQARTKNKFKVKNELKDKDKILSSRRRKATVQSLQKHRQLQHNKKRKNFKK